MRLNPHPSHSPSATAEFNINANSLHQDERDGCKCDWHTWASICCEQVKLSMDFLYTKNCWFFLGGVIPLFSVQSFNESMILKLALCKAVVITSHSPASLTCKVFTSKLLGINLCYLIKKIHNSFLHVFKKNWGHEVSSPEMPDGWNFPCAITHASAVFARLSSYQCTTTIPLPHRLSVSPSK